MAQSSIEWTEMTWNPTTGCSKITAGCKVCYAEVMSKRLQAMGIEKYKHGFSRVVTHSDELNTPYKWRKPRIVFVNSMSDLFHEDVPLEFIKKVFVVMNQCSQHTFQVLTKRSERLAEVSAELTWTPNIWMGVSVEDERVLDRVDDLRKSNALMKFLSCEPLIGPLATLDLNGIDWVIVGGESGRRPRPIRKEWVIEIMDNCKASNTPFFFKQWGGTNKKKSGRELNGKFYNEMPPQPELQTI